MLTPSPVFSAPSVVRRSVSALTSKSMRAPSSAVAVRQTPLMQTLSPMATWLREGAGVDAEHARLPAAAHGDHPAYLLDDAREHSLVTA